MGWPIPLLIFDDARGGLCVHTQDTERRFKAFEYRYEGAGTWLVAFDTVNPAPFAPHTGSESVTWRINTYAGDWGVPVDRYKSWAYTAYRVEDRAFARPAWVDDISLVVKHADYVEEKDTERYLDMLAEHVAPSRTLLFMTAWSESDTALIPNWVASEKGARFNESARKRCFRTMYFANYIGITPNHPRFAEFAPHFIRNPYSQDVEGWNLKGEWSAATDMQLYYVSPAHKLWRDYQIGQFRALFEAHPADGLFIDQSFLMFNDGNGLVNGQTTVDGNLDYHRELAEAIPGVAIGGEGINEITFQYESFCELHFLSLHLVTDTGGSEPGMGIDPGAFDRMVPIMPRFLLPHTRPIGYLAFPETHSPFYEAWRDAVHLYHGIPTITRPSVADICDPDSEVRRVIRGGFWDA